MKTPDEVIRKVEDVPTVSVIMNCLNCEKYLREAIDSVYAQTFQNWEIIFWDNASSDKSDEIARSYDSRLKYFRSPIETISLGKARNLALEKTTGKYISFLDCDDQWLSEKLEKQLATIKEHPEATFVYSSYSIMDAHGRKLRKHFNEKQPQGHVFRSFLKNYTINMQTVILERDRLFALSEQFDEYLSLSEDYDLFLRYLYENKAIYIDEPLTVYRMHPGMTSVKNIALWPDEVSYTVNKLIKLHPSIELSCKKELTHIRAKIQYYRARTEMVNCNGKAARQHLWPVCLVTVQFTVLFILTFLPCIVWKIVHHNRLK